MNTEEIQTMLTEALDLWQDQSDCAAAHFKSVRSFEEAGVMTRDNGLVLRMHDGSEFQLTIVRSR